MIKKTLTLSVLIISLAILLMAVTHIGANLDVAAPTQLFTAMQSVPAYTNVQASGSPFTMLGYSGYYWNNTASPFNWVLDTPVAGKQYCFGNYKAETSILTITTTTGVTIYYKGIAGTITTGTLVSGGAAGDVICIEGTDSTTYMVMGTGNGTWTNN